jgi:cytochrome c oxidase subunit III
MVVSLGFAVAFNIVRAFEFAHLNVSWDHDAYGSIVWLMLGFHTTHIITDLLDSTVLTVLMFTGPVEEHRFVDVEENAVYWYFVVLAWLPIYGVIYWAPRLL